MIPASLSEQIKKSTPYLAPLKLREGGKPWCMDSRFRRNDSPCPFEFSDGGAELFLGPIVFDRLLGNEFPFIYVVDGKQFPVMAPS